MGSDEDVIVNEQELIPDLMLIDNHEDLSIEKHKFTGGNSLKSQKSTLYLICLNLGFGG